MFDGDDVRGTSAQSELITAQVYHNRTMSSLFPSSAHVMALPRSVVSHLCHRITISIGQYLVA